MASQASPWLGVPPHRLWAVRPGIYEDEKGRTWVTVVVRLSPSQRARARGSPGSTVSCQAQGCGVGGRWEACARTSAQADLAHSAIREPGVEARGDHSHLS